MATSTYKCPNCNAGLQFNPATQDFACEYCGSHFTEQQMEHVHQSTAQSRPADAVDAQYAPQQPEVAMMLYSCPSCGAEIAMDATTAATHCYYCHNPVVLLGQLEGQYRPDKMIPFAMDKNAATNAFLAWTKKKWFIPKGFFSQKQIEKLSGVYFPYWLVDSDVQAELVASATKVRVWRTGDIEHTETHHYRVARQGSIHFEDISKNALQKENSKLCDGVHPFNSGDVRDYNPAFLSGFMAEKRNLEAAQVEQDVRNDINNFSKQILRNSIAGYSTVTTQHFAVNNCHLHWDYTLLPVWTLTYKGHNKKTYFYTMNGQTGKITGILPLNMQKLLLTFGAIALGVMGILALILLLGGGLR